MPLFGQCADEVHRRFLRRDIEAGGRLIRDEQAGVAGQGNGNPHTLAHATGKLVRIAAIAAFRFNDHSEIVSRPVAAQDVPPGLLYFGQLRGRTMPVAAARFAHQMMEHFQSRYECD